MKWQHLFHRRKTSWSRGTLAHGRDICFVDRVMSGKERFVVEDRTLKGATASYDPSKPVGSRIIELTGLSMLPRGVIPNFGNRSESLEHAAQGTCYIVGYDYRRNQTYTGTAFFIGPTTLITAGHNAPTKDVKIVAQYPGTPNVGDPFKVLDGSVVPTFACRVLHTHYKNETDLAYDIAVLDCAGKYCIDMDKTLSIDAVEVCVGIAVDVVGYPGKYDEDFLQQEHGNEVDDIDEAYKLAKTILPRRELAITHGIVISGGDNPLYRLSSISGMSGGPVILNGTVIGKNTPPGKPAYINRGAYWL